jgi:hypothetical protein
MQPPPDEDVPMYKPREPSWRVYGLAFVLAVGATFAICSRWFGPGHSTISAGIAGVVALFCVFLMNCLGDAIMPKVFWFIVAVVPFSIGTAVGSLCVGLWREIDQSRK